MLGQTIAHYRVVGKLGSGGMGVVYEAEDIRLGRRVALKFLPQEFVHDPKSLQRFEREARAVSFLNHPNICTLYEVEEYMGQPVIVMELLEGESLKDRIRQGGASTAEILDIGIQVSEGLEAAHAKGIIHRDLKPGNIFLLTDRRVKVLDFGLAKFLPGQVAEVDDKDLLTMEGMILGTTSYMSPEQVRGEDLDARTDIFSLGVVLYEMATGKRPFAGKNRVLLMNAILNEKPSAPSTTNPELPAALDAIIARSLEKDREKRYQHAADISSDLQQLKRDTVSGPVAVRATVPVKRQSRIARTQKLALAGVLAISAIASAAFLYFRRSSVLTERDTIVLADFTNTTGDPVFDGTLRQGMAVQLEQSPFLSLVPEERIRQTLRLMGQPADSRLTPEIAGEICERTASTTVLDGSIASLGSQYVLGIRAKDCRTGKVLAEQQVQAARKEDVLNALGKIASQFRTRLGESLATVEKYDTPLAEATTSSLEALRAYTEGLNLNLLSSSSAAIPFFKRAIDIDPKFAMAYAALGRMYGDMGENTVSAESTTRAYELRDRASDKEKFFISASYDLQVTGDLEKAQQTCELWAKAYPRAMVPHGFLAGIIYPSFGNYEKSIEEGTIAIRNEPDFGIGYQILSSSYVALGRMEEAQNALDRASERRLQVAFISIEQYSIAFLKGDKVGMEREVAKTRGVPGVEDWMSNNGGLVLAYSGHLKEARSRSQRAIDLARQEDQREMTALYETDAALREAFFGNTVLARQRAVTALRLSTSRDVEYAVAFALAMSGDSSQSQTLADDLSKRFPQDTRVVFTYVPTLSALLALNHRDPSKAVEMLQPTIPYELAARTRSHRLYPPYLRGEAYLAKGQGQQAVLEFQKIVDHRGIVLYEPIGALAHLQIGRSYAIAGDTAKAKAAYEDFLTLWKDADPDIPILQQAKTEYAKLQ